MTDRGSVLRAYDEIASAYAAMRSDDGRGMDVLETVLDGLPDEPRVLDAGCGQGRPVLRRLQETATPVGLDFSRAQLGLAAENAPDASLVQGDVVQLPLARDAFDAVTAYHALIHVPMDDHRTVVDEFARVLRPGGDLLVSEGPDEWRGTNPDWLDTGVEMQWSIAGADATRAHLRDAGFTVVDEWEVDGEEHWVFLLARLDG